jgi:hypothetical protein
MGKRLRHQRPEKKKKGRVRRNKYPKITDEFYTTSPKSISRQAKEVQTLLKHEDVDPSEEDVGRKK